MKMLHLSTCKPNSEVVDRTEAERNTELHESPLTTRHTLLSIVKPAKVTRERERER